MQAILEVAKVTSNQSEDLIHIKEILNEFSNDLSEIVRGIVVIDSNSREIRLMANDSSNEMNASTEEVTKAAQILNNMTNQMMEEVNKFKI